MLARNRATIIPPKIDNPIRGPKINALNRLLDGVKNELPAFMQHD